MPPASISAHSDLTTFICTLWSGSSFITTPRFVNIGFQTENSKVKLFLQLPERFFQDRETTLKLLVRNYKRHQHPDYVAVITAGEQYQSLFVADSGKLLRLISGRLLGFASRTSSSASIGPLPRTSPMISYFSCMARKRLLSFLPSSSPRLSRP